jgi:hypothetical protein
MWRVEENVAAYTAVQILEGLFSNQDCASHLRIIRHLFRTGKWYEMIEMAYKHFKDDDSVPAERRHQRLAGLEYLLALPADALAHPSKWGVFRSFVRC